MRACLTCVLLSECKEATAEMVEVGGRCPKWDEADDGVVQARNRVIEELGYAAVLFEPNPPRQVGETRMAVARRTILRKLAIKAGLLKASPQSFTLQVADLVEILDETYPGISDMSDEEIEALYEDTEGKPAEEEEKPKDKKRDKKDDKKDEAKPGRTRPGRARKVKEEEPPEDEEPKDEEKEEEGSEETDEKPKAKVGRVARRGRARAAAPKTEDKDEAKPKARDEKPKSKPTGDLADIIERLDLIGPMAGQGKDAAEAALKLAEETAKKVDAIVAHLTFLYNESLYDDDGDLLDSEIEPITSLEDGDWS